MFKLLLPWLDRLFISVTTAFESLWLTARSKRSANMADDEPAPIYALPSPRYEEHLTIPVRDKAPDDTAWRAAQERGQFLARQERWEDLAREMRQADEKRECTPGGVPIAELLAFGARSDVVLAAEHALREERAPRDGALIEGIKGLEIARRELGNDPHMSALVAQAHLDIGWAWRGETGQDEIAPLNRKRCLAHFERATKLMAPFNGLELDSPMVAATQCALLVGQADAGARVSDDYEDLIDLDPNNHRHMRALGCHLLPRWFGTYDELELQARRTAARTQDIWGAGGYTWVYFDAMALDEVACEQVDLDFFIDGLHDIIATHPEQEMINLLAAFCAVAIRQGEDISALADQNRAEIADCANWLIRDHLTEVHPMVWAHALTGFDNNLRVTSVNRFAARGKRFALQAIGELFCEEIGRGAHITFTPQGPRYDAT